MDRRRFLTLLAAGTAVSLGAGCTAAEGADQLPSAAIPPDQPAPKPPLLLGPPPESARVPVPGGPITAIPGTGNNIALTVDDGADPDVIGAYIQFANDTGARFTFFVTGAYPGWTTHRQALRPLVESGQIQLSNHTWNHPDLTGLSAAGISQQLQQTKSLLQNNFGVDGTPYYRPPFGYRNATVDAIAADHGYSVPTLWEGSLSDSGLITEQYLVEMAHKYFHGQKIIIGHANHPPITRVYDQLVDVIRERNLAMVTLNDIFSVPS